MTNRTWYTDQHAESTFREFERQIAPLIAKLLPSFRMTHIGMNRYEDRLTNQEEIKVVLHLRPLGEAYAIDELLKAKAVTRAALENNHD